MFRSVSESSIDSSVPGNYRYINEGSKLDLVSSDVTEEPKKERERFRDKMKVAFKLKSSKPSNSNQENIDGVKDADEFMFGPNLETVEKDAEHNFVPRIVVECKKAINQRYCVQIVINFLKMF